MSRFLVDAVPRLRGAWSADNEHDIEKIMVGSDKFITLTCEEDHTWTTQAKIIGKGGWCPYCSGRRILPGTNDFATVCADIVSNHSIESMNPDVDLTTLSATKHSIKLTLLCSNGHKVTQSPLSLRNSGVRCRECNSFGSVHPEKVQYWSDKNTKSPYEVAPSDNNDYWFNCAVGHEFNVSAAKVTNEGRWCPYCSGRRVNETNSISTLFPELAAEWSSDNTLSPDEVSPGSAKDIIWKCKKNPDHTWTTQPYHRTGKNRRGCPYCTNQRLQGYQDSLEAKFPEIAAEWDYDKNDDTPDQVHSKSSKRRSWRCKNNPSHTWETRVSNRVVGGTGCPECFSSERRMESDFMDTIKELVGDLDARTRCTGVLPGRHELDVYIPELSLAFEFNGSFWHSDHPKYGNPFSHKKKMEMCNKLGIRLVVIWEDDWIDRRDIVINLLASLLGKDSRTKIGARSTKVDPAVPSSEASGFLVKNHIQGYVGGSLKIGLRDSSGSLVALSVFKRTGEVLSLERYATSARVPGGLSKILSYVDKNISYEKMTTFASKEISDGSLYEATGWTNVGEIRSDYSYLVGFRRVNKRNFRKEDFKNKPNLTYIEGATEKEMAVANKLWRTYDLGKIKYERTPCILQQNSV